MYYIVVWENGSLQIFQREPDWCWEQEGTSCYKIDSQKVFLDDLISISINKLIPLGYEKIW